MSEHQPDRGRSNAITREHEVPKLPKRDLLQELRDALASRDAEQRPNESWPGRDIVKP
ncbi:MAG TPA: hypothetical protein VKH41_11760 [Myxococcota bacterium]|nr:hypothetical protein [Myxococcota bacterium]